MPSKHAVGANKADSGFVNEAEINKQNILKAVNLICLAGDAAMTVVKNAADSSASLGFFSAKENQEKATRFVDNVAQLVHAFQGDASCSASERQNAYRQFIETMIEISSTSRVFSSPPSQQMTRVCMGIGEVLYERTDPPTLSQIQSNLGQHLELTVQKLTGQIGYNGPTLSSQQNYQP